MSICIRDTTTTIPPVASPRKLGRPPIPASIPPGCEVTSCLDNHRLKFIRRLEHQDYHTNPSIKNLPLPRRENYLERIEIQMWDAQLWVRFYYSLYNVLLYLCFLNYALLILMHIREYLAFFLSLLLLSKFWTLPNQFEIKQTRNHRFLRLNLFLWPAWVQMIKISVFSFFIWFYKS